MCGILCWRSWTSSQYMGVWKNGTWMYGVLITGVTPGGMFDITLLEFLAANKRQSYVPSYYYYYYFGDNVISNKYKCSYELC